MNILRLVMFLIGVLTANCLVANDDVLRFHQFSTHDGLSQNAVLAIAQDKYGFMWFGTWEGLNRFDGHEFRRFRAVPDDPNSISNNRINAIIADDNGTLWIETGDNRFVFKYNYATENFTRYLTEEVDAHIRLKLSNYTETRRSASNAHFSWQVIQNRLIQRNLQTNKEIIYRQNDHLPFALRDEHIYSLFLDKHNALWVGTHNGGVHVASPNGQRFGYVNIGHGTTSANRVRAIHADKSGRLWIGTEADGVTILHRENNGNITHFGETSLIDPQIRSILTDHLGYVWVGTKGGLSRYNPTLGNFKHYYPRTDGSILHPWVFSMMEDYRGVLWVGTFGGLSRYDRSKDQFVNYPDASFLNSNRIRYILEDASRNVWIATEGSGITRLQRDTLNGQFDAFIPTHYRHIEGDPTSLINDLVLSLQEDKHGYIWVGTNSGLCRLDPDNGKVVRFSVANGFPDDLIMGILACHKGYVWVSHKKGLTRIQIDTFEMRTFNRYDGLQGDEFLQNSVFKHPVTGEMFFGGINGISSFFPDQIMKQDYSPPPLFTGLKIMNQQVHPGMEHNGRILLQQSLLLNPKLQLRYEDSFFSISFTSLHFINPNASRYKYRMVGAHEEWIYTDATRREATYTHLSAGKYRFELFSANSDGVWSNQPAVLHITILPPWWLSIWAKMLYAVIFFILAWFVYRYLAAKVEFSNKLALERLKNEKNEELMNLKLKFFTDISHEFRTPLTLILEPLQRLIDEATDEQQRQYYYQLMQKNAQQLLALINQLLDFRKLQSGKLHMNFVNDNLVAFVRSVASAFEQKAREKQIRFAVLSNLQQIQVDFDRDKMRKIWNNLIANAFRFTPNYGEIIIRVYLPAESSDSVCVEIEDNGTGISPEHSDKIFDPFYQATTGKSASQGTGIGLALCKELVQLHKGDIQLFSGIHGGARFVVTIPLKQASTDTIPVENATMDFDMHPAENVSYIPDNHTAADLPLVLVVEDNEDIVSYIAHQLKAKYRVITANDGLAGFYMASEHIPDIIISDITMPGIDGFELCKRLKADEHTSHIPIVLLTSRHTDDAKIEGYNTGADAFMTKPFNKKILESRLKNLLEKRNLMHHDPNNGVAGKRKKVAINITDEAFLNKVSALVRENMENSEFEANTLAQLMKMSRTQLYRKIKALTNRSVHDFIITIRMNKAREMLLGGVFSISEIAYKVGFSLPTNFTRTFTKYFGLSPSKYVEKYKK